MIMSNKTITVTKDDTAMVQAAHVRLESISDLVASLDERSVNNGVLDALIAKFEKAKTEFEMAKQNISDKYLSGKAVDWSLDYKTCTLTYTEH